MKDRIVYDPTLDADSDKIGAYLKDAAGTLLTSTLVSGKQSLDVNVTQSALPSGAATEATLATLATEVTAAAILADTSSIDSNVASILSDTSSIDATLSALSKAEDSVHGSGDQGVMALGVRNDAGTPLAADGDYIPFSMDANGALRVAAEVSVEPSDAEYAEDSAHSSGDVGLQILAVRNDAGGSLVDTDGDYGSLQLNAQGELRVAASVASSVPNTAILVSQNDVSNTAELVVASALSSRKKILIENASQARAVFLGHDNTVTDADGFRLSAGSVIELELGPAIDLYAITAAGTADLRIFEIS